MKSDPAVRYLIVRQLSDHAEIHRVDVTGRSERDVEKIERGMLRKIDTELFFLDDSFKSSS